MLCKGLFYVPHSLRSSHTCLTFNRCPREKRDLPDPFPLCPSPGRRRLDGNRIVLLKQVAASGETTEGTDGPHLVLAHSTCIVGPKGEEKRRKEGRWRDQDSPISASSVFDWERSMFLAFFPPLHVGEKENSCRFRSSSTVRPSNISLSLCVYHRQTKKPLEGRRVYISNSRGEMSSVEKLKRTFLTKEEKAVQ